ncbi:RsmB/NOP family class I SAM-dependent RNA methyltransferase [Roseibacterium sp. SDUM158016]|uniref:RsmB/NOP family class I SAM-dependent RNA methyltransferase n=1 Tax=Roseicyclus sediminis TaxID=2980997 RepID=UPI0021CEA607|nr:RsmB/NOP family class I SAM-dependent RNA methyltransferase [Roseibacterium sp. SDUM158016]MCU4655210.1 RsmB/NOP family class I SAM-dependent RNA methyltransferase [Roseibacterium sp. SDUM158016]
MTPGARLSAAIGVLDDWREGLAVEQALTRWARGARYAGSGDRAAVRDLVYAVLRRRASASRLGGGEEARALVLGLLRLEGTDPDTLFTGEGHAPAPLSEAERASAVAGPSDPVVDVPGWLREPIGARAADAGGRAALFEAMTARAPVWLRVALRRGGRDDAQASLAAEGIETRADARCATALEVTAGARRVRASAAYRDGLVELQDLSAQRAVAGVPWPRTGRILDLCAGGGGKSLAIADGSDARVFAHDANPARMADLPVRAARAGVRIDRIGPDEVACAAPFEAVLCDVPCSGSGTWRRDPEAKWRLTPDRLQTLLAAQAGILDAAAPRIAEDGRLVYMTCSLLPQENEEQVSAFLDRHPDWTLDMTRLDTPLTASDGFFTAVFVRSGKP